jgi:hypothetical protein
MLATGQSRLYQRIRIGRESSVCVQKKQRLAAGVRSARIHLYGAAFATMNDVDGRRMISQSNRNSRIGAATIRHDHLRATADERR